MANVPERLTTEEVAVRLGVKPETVYAYVSRGLLHSSRGPDGRTSRFSSDEVERLLERSQRGGSKMASRVADGVLPDSVMQTRVSALGDGVLRYREIDARELAVRHTFEEVAMFLWGGDLSDPGGWTPDSRASKMAGSVQARLPASTLLLERLQLIVPAAAALDPLRHDLQARSVQFMGRSLIATAIDALPPLQDSRGTSTEASSSVPLVERLWPRLSQRQPTTELLDTLNAAMILMADHGLSPSTLAVRIVASGGSDPASCISAGLAAARGALHGGASLALEELLSDAFDATDIAARIGQRLRRGDNVVGFGHPRYPHGDPRAATLLKLIGESAIHSERWVRLSELLTHVDSRRLPPPNVDFALAALSHVSEMQHGSAEAIFSLSRMVGWLAHAMEQYAGNEMRRQF